MPNTIDSPEKTASSNSNFEWNWDWNYQNEDDEQSRIKKLYRKAVSDQWSAVESLDWSQTIDPSRPLIQPSRFMPISTMAYDKLSRQQQEKLIVGLTNVSFSQILHGELGALMVASELVHCLPGHEMKQAASAQVMDEARHLDVFTRYVRRQGEIFPPSPPLKRILDMIARYPLWQGQMVGMQIVIEGIAMATFIDTREATTCPLLKDILHLVIKDEARHISFGKMSLRQHIELMSIEERAQLDSFIIQLLQEFQAWGGHPEDMLNFCQILIEADIDPTDMISATLRDVEAGQPLNLSRGMRYAFTHIILPNLQDLGLVSPEKTNSILQAMPTTQMDFASLDRLKNQLLA